MPHGVPLFVEQSRFAEKDFRRSELRRQLITEYLPLAQHIARRFNGRGAPFDDVLQVARTGRIHVVGCFDPEWGVSVQYHALKAGHDYGQYVRDADNAGRQDIADFFRKVMEEDSARAKQCHQFLKQLSGSSESGPAVS